MTQSVSIESSSPEPNQANMGTVQSATSGQIQSSDTVPESVPGRVDHRPQTEDSALREDFAHLRAEFSALKRQVQHLRATSVEMLYEDDDTENHQRNDTIAMAEEAEKYRKQMEVIEADFLGEAFDQHWSFETKTVIQEALSTDEIAQFALVGPAGVFELKFTLWVNKTSLFNKKQ